MSVYGTYGTCPDSDIDIQIVNKQVDDVDNEHNSNEKTKGSDWNEPNDKEITTKPDKKLTSDNAKVITANDCDNLYLDTDKGPFYVHLSEKRK